MKHKAVPILDAGLQQIADWCAWFLGAQQQVIHEHTGMQDDERALALAEAERLTTAIRERMVHDYNIRQQRAPR